MGKELAPRLRLAVGVFLNNLIHDSALPGLVQPIFEPEWQGATDEFLKVLPEKIDQVLIQEGRRGIRYINGLSEKNKKALLDVLIQSGMGGTEYKSGDEILLIPKELDEVPQDVQWETIVLE